MMNVNDVKLSGILWDVHCVGDSRKTYGTALLESSTGAVKLFFDTIRLLNQFTSLKAGSEIVIQGRLSLFDSSLQVHVANVWLVPHGGVKELGLKRMQIRDARLTPITPL